MFAVQQVISESGHLKRHSLIHTGEKPHNCNQCNYSTYQVSHLKKHIMKHTGEKPHKCNQCDYTTIQSSTLKRHKRTHSGEKLHRCTTCESSFIQTNQLKVHMMRNHTVEKPSRCNQYNFTCTSNGELQQHIRTDSGEKQMQQSFHMERVKTTSQDIFELT